MSITAKELSWLEDQLGLESLLIKKYRQAASETSDGELKSKCESIAKQHESHYNQLMNYLG